MNTANLSSSCADDSIATTQPIALKRGELHRWEHAGVGMTVQACEGAVWVTQEGDGRDVILSAGETFRITRRGRVIAEALQGSAQLCVVDA
jgi:hypothetical protein